ncbi:AAA family ATPase [Sedimenticola hydrogenitrophicus]|uniref:AAA family ATPase n=1 Tax=Sedimenticola hydrogenitrophicus TaxID=2967975 RepID=UPI0023B0E164|nr:AAA family ATPase [Sedimenticola hydrogenitrophicus]
MNDAVAMARTGLEDEQILHDLVRVEMASAGLSQERASTEIGISGSALSQWLSGKYPSDPAELELKIRRWLDARTERARMTAALPTAPAWVETTTARRILAGLSYAQMAGDIAVVYGGAGLGKTKAARHYAIGHPNVWVATMTSSTNTLGPCLERVALACGLRPTNTRACRIEADLVERLEETNGLLIIDEAQHLNTRAIEALRGLHDATGVGLAIMGNEIIYTRITGGRRSAEFAQLFSRIGKRVRLTRPRKDDVEALLEAWGITAREEREAVLEIARSQGALRMVTKCLRLATLFAKGEGVNLRHIRAAWRDLGGEG